MNFNFDINSATIDVLSYFVLPLLISVTGSIIYSLLKLVVSKSKISLRLAIFRKMTRINNVARIYCIRNELLFFQQNIHFNAIVSILILISIYCVLILYRILEQYNDDYHVLVFVVRYTSIFIAAYAMERLFHFILTSYTVTKIHTEFILRGKDIYSDEMYHEYISKSMFYKNAVEYNSAISRYSS